MIEFLFLWIVFGLVVSVVAGCFIQGLGDD